MNLSKKLSFLHGYRKFIGFVAGTLLTLLCIALSHDKPENFTSFLTIWCSGVYAVYAVGNHFEKTADDKKDIEFKKIDVGTTKKED